MMSLKSPVPAPDQSVFDARVFSSKKKTPGNRPQCPSPPLKTPPVSRIFTDQPLITPTAKIIHTPGTFLTTPEHSLFHTPYVSFFEQYFENLGEIGSGSFGHVFKARSKTDGRVYAVKRSRHQFRGTKDRQRALNEVWFAAQLPAHPHVLKYANAWEENGYLFIQTELCEVGSLKDSLERRTAPLSEDTIWRYLLDMVLGIKHIHLHNLLHLDIKPANLFLTEEGYLKIGDFGLVHQLGDIAYDMEGDSRYMALELLSEDANSVSFPADIFCIGASCFEMVTNVEMPSNGVTWAELRRGNVARYMPPTTSPELGGLIAAMMAPDPSARPTPDQLLSHWKLQQILASRVYSGTTPIIYHQPVPLTSSPPLVFTVPTPVSNGAPSSAPQSVATFLQSPVATAPAHNTSLDSSEDDCVDDDDDFLVQPRNLSNLFTQERAQQRRESFEGAYGKEEPPVNNNPVSIAPKNLLDMFNSTDDGMDD